MSELSMVEQPREEKWWAFQTFVPFYILGVFLPGFVTAAIREVIQPWSFLVYLAAFVLPLAYCWLLSLVGELAWRRSSYLRKRDSNFWTIWTPVASAYLIPTLLLGIWWAFLPAAAGWIVGVWEPLQIQRSSGMTTYECLKRPP